MSAVKPRPQIADTSAPVKGMITPYSRRKYSASSTSSTPSDSARIKMISGRNAKVQPARIGWPVRWTSTVPSASSSCFSA